MKILFFIMLLPQVVQARVFQDAVLLPYIQEAAEILSVDKEKVDEISFSFVDELSRPSYSAECFQSTRVVRFNKKDWTTASESMRVWRMVHEMNHCAFNAPHTAPLTEGTCDVSMGFMQSLEPREWCVEQMVERMREDRYKRVIERMFK